MNPVLDAALRYASLGLPVLPCSGKHPVTPNGFKDASIVPEVIKAWFSDSLDLNVAIAIPRDRIVLDIDGEVGDQELATHGFTPPSTATVLTSRGRHLWYEWNYQTPPVRKIEFLPKVDILCKGYVLAPPSKHPSGKPYAWDVDISEGCEVAPEWLETAAFDVIAQKETIDPEEWFRGLKPGSRQTGLFRYACRLRANPRISKTEARVLVAELARLSEGTGYEKYPDTDALVERVWKTYEAATDPDGQEDESRVWSLADLLSGAPSRPDYLVDNLLPGTGYTILFASQGAGKSILADQVAACVAGGVRLFGRPTKQAGVLVLDIEQDPAGAAERWRKLLAGLAFDSPPANLHIAFSWPTLNEGGFDKLARFLVEHSQVKLVVVDTLAQATTMAQEGGNAYFSDNQEMSKFIKFSKKYGVAFLIISHSRKSVAGSSDSFADACSGSRGITAPAKARWWINRPDGEDAGTLWVGGKIPEGKLSLTFDREFLLWR